MVHYPIGHQSALELASDDLDQFQTPTHRRVCKRAPDIRQPQTKRYFSNDLPKLFGLFTHPALDRACKTCRPQSVYFAISLRLCKGLM